MTRPALLLLVIVLASAPSARANTEASLESAIQAAVQSAEKRVVQLRYFGDGGDSLGASAAPVTGYSLGQGWVLTSLYGLGEEPAAIVARYPDGSQRSLAIAGRDHSRRLVLLKSERAGPPPRPGTGRGPTAGETAIALGRVYSAEEVSVTVGVVSAVGRLGGRATQTDAAVSPANYGGPLIGLDGAWLGILTPLSPPGQSGVGLYDSGIGFAVTPNQIAERLPRLAAGEDIHAGWLGAAFADDDPLRERATLLKVSPDSPAERTGLKKDDTITSLAGKPTPTIWALRAVLSGLDARSDVPVTIEDTKGKTQRLSVRLAKQPDSPAKTDKPAETPKIDPSTKKPDGP